MSQNSLANYFKTKVAYPVMICNSVLCPRVVWCDQILCLERVPKKVLFC